MDMEMDRDDLSRPSRRIGEWRAYFVVSGKDGQAALSIEHDAQGQSLVLPTYPSNAVPDALPLLHPIVAHYTAQWERINVDPTDRDARGFWIPAEHMPANLLANLDDEEAIKRIQWRHLDEAFRRFWGGEARFMAQVGGIGRSDPATSYVQHNNDDFVITAEEAGIDPWPGG